MRTIALITLMLVSTAFATTVERQIAELLQVGSKANDAIDGVFDLLNDLKESNVEAQQEADIKNSTDEEIGQATISKFTQILSLNQQVFENAKNNRAFFEQELRDTKTYLAWNEARQEEIERKSESLLDNQCYSNQLFVRSLRFNQEALEAIRYLKQDVNGYILNGADNFDLAQVATNADPEQQGVETIAERLKKYSTIFNDNEVSSFLALADKDSEDSDDSSDSEDEVDNAFLQAKQPQRQSGRRGTLPEQIYSVLEDLEARVNDAINNLQQNEIAAAWELAAWIGSSRAEIDGLVAEHERKALYADRSAQQIQAAIAQQAKVNVVLQESRDALDQAISDLENKREVYGEAKAKRDQENALLDEVISQFKSQVASWSGRRF